MTQKLHKAIKRVETMEWYFDTVQNAMEKDPLTIKHSPFFRALVVQLQRYYEGGKWIEDFALDEEKLFPPTLKRGVLSEDGLYNFLARYDEMTKIQR